MEVGSDFLLRCKSDDVIKAPPAPIEKLAVKKHHEPHLVIDIGRRVRGVSTLQDVTVVITTYRRPEMLLNAFRSCLRSGVRNIVVTASGVTQQEAWVYRRIKEMYPPVRVIAKDEDRGCNEAWLRGVEMAETEWVHILHDDDLILTEFFELGGLLKTNPAPFYHFNAQRHGAGQDGFSDSFPGLDTGVYTSDILWPKLLNKGGLSLSPISGLFHRDHLISVLSECEREFTDESHFLRPGMMVGNDLLIWLRAVENYPKFCFVRDPLVSYGHWDGSTTFNDVFNHENKLPAIYDAARDYYLTGPNIQAERWLVHLRPAFGVGTKSVDFASSVWSSEHANGPWIDEWLRDSQMPRLFQDDRRRVPYLKDMIEIGMEGKPESSIFVFSNSDVIPSRGITRLLLQAFETHECAYSYRRDVDELRVFSPEEIRTKATVYSGLDLFAFTREWWDANSSALPDLLFATELWDYCLKLLMDSTGGKRFQYLIYHLRHEPEGLRNRDSRSQKYNREKAEPFLKTHGGLVYWRENDPKQTASLNPR